MPRTGTPVVIVPVEKSIATLHRDGVTAADVLAAPGTVTCTKINSVGALLANTYYVKVVAGNKYGRTTTTAGDTSVTTSGSDLCVKAAFAKVTGAEYYDIYCSTASNPLFAGRITEAQRLSGIVIDAVNSTAAGGAANSVYIYPVGTGLAADTTAAVNTAYSPPTALDCTGFTYCDFDVICTRSGDSVAAAMVWAPFFQNAQDDCFYQGTAVTMSFGGASGLTSSMYQRHRVTVSGCSGISFTILSISGTGMTVSVYATLS